MKNSWALQLTERLITLLICRDYWEEGDGFMREGEKEGRNEEESNGGKGIVGRRKKGGKLVYTYILINTARSLHFLP